VPIESITGSRQMQTERLSLEFEQRNVVILLFSFFGGVGNKGIYRTAQYITFGEVHLNGRVRTAPLSHQQCRRRAFTSSC
jgi:hypothetical protein